MAKSKKDDDKQDETSDGTIAVNDAWTGMLAISLLALVVGTGFLAWDYIQYSQGDISNLKVPKLSSTPPAPPQSPKADGATKDAEKKQPVQ